MATMNDVSSDYPVSIIPFIQNGAHMTPHPALAAHELSLENSKKLMGCPLEYVTKTLDDWASSDARQCSD